MGLVPKIVIKYSEPYTLNWMTFREVLCCTRMTSSWTTKKMITRLPITPSNEKAMGRRCGCGGGSWSVNNPLTAAKSARKFPSECWDFAHPPALSSPALLVEMGNGSTQLETTTTTGRDKPRFRYSSSSLERIYTAPNFTLLFRLALWLLPSRQAALAEFWREFLRCALQPAALWPPHRTSKRSAWGRGGSHSVPEIVQLKPRCLSEPIFHSSSNKGCQRGIRAVESVLFLSPSNYQLYRKSWRLTGSRGSKSSSTSTSSTILFSSSVPGK